MYRAIRCTSLLFSLFLMLIAVSASFSQKVVISDKLPDDSRLNKPITLRVWKAQLTDVLAQVSSQTGVKVEADSGKRFWSVRQRKVSIIVKDMKLRDFLTQLEKLLGYNIRHTGTEGKYVYTFWQDLHARKIEQELLKTQKDAKVKYRERALYDTLSDAERALSLSPAEIELAKKSDPWIAYLASDPEARQFATVLTSIPQEQYDKLLSELDITIPLNTLGSDAQNAVREFYDSYSTSWLGKIDKEYWGDCTPDGIWIYKSIRDGDKPDPGHVFHVCVMAKANDESKYRYDARIPTPFFDIAPRDSESYLERAARFKLKAEGLSDEEINKRIYETMSKLVEEGKSRSEVFAGIIGKQISSLKNPSISKVDLDLEKTVKLNLNLEKSVKLNLDESKSLAPYISDSGSIGVVNGEILKPMIENLADGTGMNVMYEAFSLHENWYVSLEQEQTLGKLLSGVADNNHLDWVKDGNTIRFRAKDWAERRSWEFPDEWKEKWYASIKANYGLSWDEMIDIVLKLNDDQIDHSLIASQLADLNCYDDPDQAVLFRMASGVTWSRDVLRFYGNLDSSQQAKLWSDQGLNMDEISEDQVPKLYGMDWIKDNQINIYNAVFFCKHDKDVDSGRDSVFIGEKVQVWAKDLPDDIRVEKIAQMKAESKEEFDPNSKPIEFTYGSSVFVDESKAEVKKMVDLIEQKKKEKALNK